MDALSKSVRHPSKKPLLKDEASVTLAPNPFLFCPLFCEMWCDWVPPSSSPLPPPPPHCPSSPTCGCRRCQDGNFGGASPGEGSSPGILPLSLWWAEGWVGLRGLVLAARDCGCGPLSATHNALALLYLRF